MATNIYWIQTNPADQADTSKMYSLPCEQSSEAVGETFSFWQCECLCTLPVTGEYFPTAAGLFQLLCQQQASQYSPEGALNARNQKKNSRQMGKAHLQYRIPPHLDQYFLLQAD